MRTKKSAMTLLEIMIVIFLIGLIGSVIGYNMKGSLEEGKAFCTQKAIDQVYDIIQLVVAQGEMSLAEAVKNPEGCLAISGLVKEPSKLIHDGWGALLDIAVNQNTGELKVSSENLKKYKDKKENLKKP